MSIFNSLYPRVFIVFLFFNFNAVSQNVVIDTAAIRADLSAMDKDSLLQELKVLIGSESKSKSFFSAYLTASNRLFSTINNAFNAQQTTTNIALTPSLSYYHKSGFGISTTSYLRPTSTSGGLYQLAITPSYDFIGDKIMYGVSYTNYIKTDPSNSYTTPYDNEVYGYIQERKTWLRPSLTIGWAGGSYKDVSTSQIRMNGNLITIKDTSRITINDFSAIFGLSHNFKFIDVLSNDDMLTIIPQVSLIGGIQGYQRKSLAVGNVMGPRSREDDLMRIRERYNFRSASSVSSFSLQTLAASLNLSWYKGPISFSGGYFSGYYFNSGTSSKWSHIFNVSLGLTF